MSFESPERMLTKEEWNALAEVAADKASDYLHLSGTCLRSGGEQAKLANYYARKASRIFKFLIDLENEHYASHPDEDPNRNEELTM